MRLKEGFCHTIWINNWVKQPKKYYLSSRKYHFKHVVMFSTSEVFRVCRYGCFQSIDSGKVGTLPPQFNVEIGR